MLLIDIHTKALHATKAAKVNTLMAQVSSLFERVAALEKKVSSSKVTPSTTKEDSAPAYPVTPRDDEPVKRVKVDLTKRGVQGAQLKWVPSHYYQQSLSWRRDILKAPSIAHLCKSMFVENTSFSDRVLNDPLKHNNERYYIVVFQYVEKFDSDKLMKYFRDVNPGIGKKNFNYRVSDKGEELTGFSPGGFTVFGMKENITVVLSQKVLQLLPKSLVLGGGHIDVKLMIDAAEFIRVLQPIVADVTVPLSEEELADKL